MPFSFGIAYSPSRASDTYCKDFFTTDYKDQWSSTGRGDLTLLKELGFQLLLSYYWDPYLDHSAFLTECERVGLGVAVPIHNGLVHGRDVRGAKKLVDETRGRSCVRAYIVSNELPRDDSENIAFMVGQLQTWGVTQTIMYTSIFDENFETAKSVLRAIHNRTKLLVGVNMYFLGNPPEDQGTCLAGAINQWAHDPDTAGVPIYVPEYGYNKQDATTALKSALNGIKRIKASQPRCYGVSLFEHSNEPFKGSTNNENQYGLILDENGNRKPTYQILKDFRW